MHKHKKLKILFLGLVMAAGGYFIAQKSAVFFKAEPTGQKPEVLGAFIDARGEPGPADLANKKNFPFLLADDLKTVKAKSYRVFALDGGQILTEKQPDLKLPIASLTKLMTAYITYQTLDFQSLDSVKNPRAANISPSLGLKDGDSVQIGDLFNAMLIGSANDAAFELASAFEKRFAGTDFTDEMNAQAALLNMNDSNFSNPAGFDIGRNFSTAADMQKLVNATFSLAAFKNLSRKTSYSFAGALGKDYRVRSTNRLINKYDDILAVKTGYTQNSLGSMVTVLETSFGDVGIIVLDSPQRETDTLLIRKAILNAIASDSKTK